jgi:hypothetical protein
MSRHNPVSVVRRTSALASSHLVAHCMQKLTAGARRVKCPATSPTLSLGWARHRVCHAAWFAHSCTALPSQQVCAGGPQEPIITICWVPLADACDGSSGTAAPCCGKTDLYTPARWCAMSMTLTAWAQTDTPTMSARQSAHPSRNVWHTEFYQNLQDSP